MKRIDPQTVRQQMDALVAAYPEIGEDEILRADMFEAETDLHEFMTAIEKIRRAAVGFSDGLDGEIDELRARRDRFRRRDDAIRSLMFKVMQWADLKKLEIQRATISVRRGTPRVLISDERAVPDNLCRIVRSPDLTKIREALNAFETVPGAELSNAEPTLAIRIK